MRLLVLRGRSKTSTVLENQSFNSHTGFNMSATLPSYLAGIKNRNRGDENKVEGDLVDMQYEDH